ncbi:MAG: aspartate 1-decarboxylase [Phycisphaerae bacterium]|nr:aspartate 1-decarboxylase [Phycisphaerae bacterium]
MLREVLFAKIHRAEVTAARPDYVGSITLDADWMEATGLRASDRVLISNCRNAERFETYVLWSEHGSRKLEINGAAAHLVEVGDPLIIMHFALMSDEEYRSHRPKVLVMGPGNQPLRVQRYEPR